MKLQTAFSFTAVFILVFTLLVFPAMADDESRQTHGEIDFIAGTGPISPLDPDYPNNDLTDLADVNITNDSDSLSLNVIPDFIFAQTDGTAFPAQLVGEKSYTLYSPQRPYVQVSDLRGTGGGWTLSVSASQFTRDGTPAIGGAKIRLSGGTAHSSNPTLSPLSINDSIVIECTNQAVAPVTVVNAPGDNNGMGAWIIRWYPLDSQGRFTASTPAHAAGVDLYVPSDTLALPGNYSVTLCWTLSDAA